MSDNTNTDKISADHIKGAIEAMLYAFGEPLTVDAMATGLGVKASVVLEAITSLQDDYTAENRGIYIVKLNDGYELATKREFYDVLCKVLARETKYVFSDAMLETKKPNVFVGAVTPADRFGYVCMSTSQQFELELFDTCETVMLEINPDIDVRLYKCFFLPENAADFPFEEYDYIVDAVDTVTAKIELIMRAQALNVPIISAMGAGNKLDPGRFKIADIYDTSVCPLARVMRRELKKRNVKSLKVVYSDEQPIRPIEDMSISCRTHCICPPGAKHKCTERRDIPGSTAFVPAVAGLMIAGEIVKDLSIQASSDQKK